MKSFFKKKRSKLTLPSLHCPRIQVRNWTPIVLVLIFFWIYSKVVTRVCFNLYQGSVPEKGITEEGKSRQVFNRRELGEEKTILLWNWRQKNIEPFKIGTELFKNCPQKFCKVYKEEYFPAESYDAIIFRRGKVKPPEKRDPEQVYIFFSEDPAAATNPLIDNFFNWTMTYRFNSDIYFPKVEFVPKEVVSRTDEITKKVSEQAASENSTTDSIVVWYQRGPIRSTFNGFVKKLSLFCDIHIYRKNREREVILVKEFKEFEKKHKFVLIFQEKDCVDYISDEVYEVLRYNLVPVVFGMTKSKQLLPNNSVIIGEELLTAAGLGAFLKYLAMNDEFYVEYFEWKKKYEMDFSRKNSSCQLCSALNAIPLPRKTIDSSRWSGRQTCTTLRTTLLG